METLEFDKAKNTEIEEQTVNKENYFFKISTKSERKSEKNIDTGKLNQIKAKIKENMDKQSKYKESKEIPVDEAFKLLKEHEKRIQVDKENSNLRYFKCFDLGVPNETSCGKTSYGTISQIRVFIFGKDRKKKLDLSRQRL